MVFVTKERPILTVLKQMILDEIKQSNGTKPPKINFFMIFCKLLPHKRTFCWKVPSKNIYTFYLKHRKYPFCAPIFHPLSETESYGIDPVENSVVAALGNTHVQESNTRRVKFQYYPF